MRGYEDRIADILKNADKYHAAFNKAATFSGPSLYFHRRALETRHLPGDSSHLEYVYATLASWGMHRMGPGGSKMRSFEEFRRSIEPLMDRISQAQKFDFRAMDDPKWAIVEHVFRGIKIMDSATSIVGHSKVMHHMMPDIVPPIDRRYTLRYLHRNTNIRNGLDREWLAFREIVSGFFIPVASDREFLAKASQWVATQDECPWDTSVLKVVDNLLIGAAK